MLFIVRFVNHVVVRQSYHVFRLMENILHPLVGIDSIGGTNPDEHINFYVVIFLDGKFHYFRDNFIPRMDPLK